MQMASLVVGILGILATVLLTLLVLRESRKAERTSSLVLATIMNGLTELIPDDQAVTRIFQPLLHEGYMVFINRADGVRYYSASKNGEIVLGSMGVGKVEDVPRTPINIEWR